MGDEVSIDALARMVRRVVREELERDDKRVTQAVLKLVLADLGVKKGTGEKHVITAGKG